MKRATLFTLALATLTAAAQNPSRIAPAALHPDTLDPTRNPSLIVSKLHTQLPEQYIWTRKDAVPEHAPFGPFHSTDNLQPHLFRSSFHLSAVPAHATLYVAGPRSATIFVNGVEVDRVQLNLDQPLNLRVFAIDVTHALHPGDNVVAIEAIRGKQINSGADNRLSIQQTRGEVLVVKLTSAVQGIDTPALLRSDAHWKATTESAPAGWQTPSFNDTSWLAADTLGPIESSLEFFQWNADAGLYDWPGYSGISPFLEQYTLDPVTVSHVYAGQGSLEQNASTVHVQLPPGRLDASAAPQVILDFGREVVGRLAVNSLSNTPSDVLVQYGESEAELFHQPYLGIDPLHVPANAGVFGPKSALRYALVRFVGGRDARLSLKLFGINYPVQYQGSFQSSNPTLNRLWALGAYTAHLCMQDDIWDAPKRDRGRWMGDLDVSGRTIEDVFNDHFLMEHTLDRLLGPSPVTGHVNTIAGYSAFWVTGEAEYYRHVGDRKQLSSVHDRLVELLHFMSTELDAQNLYSNKTHS